MANGSQMGIIKIRHRNSCDNHGGSHTLDKMLDKYTGLIIEMFTYSNYRENDLGPELSSTVGSDCARAKDGIK